MKKIAVIGCGNMAGAVVRAMNDSNKEGIEFLTFTPSKTRAIELAKEVGGSVLENLEDVAKADYIMIGCKPQQFSELAKMLEGVDLSEKVIISIMAGIGQLKVSELLSAPKVIRLMPSLPMEHGEGICLLHYSPAVEDSEKDFLSTILKKNSMLFELENEDAFDQVTVVSASGPAYIYYFMAAMEKTLGEWGVKKEDQRALVAQLFRGSAKSALQKSDMDLEDMIGQVTSKKGVTIEAIDRFRRDELSSGIQAGLEQAANRSFEIKKSL
ncbi:MULTISPECIES: pyrroline-5-carboxylate reductase family protein [unclassified Halobacteriovorax]|uniref:pyrroline-5-carboxylate reductase family protein n=1 Tax=unclassified Halobacteriovorax TaxID=2639665 RepID=UPI000EA0C31F|nr:pyrroline-5-carboxylate reductase dimerization domain-containing protein [Halobacteriovorax sp. BALOs_7]AYF43981.1 putative pyrroline-5-carboxylate reductase [Halobacteriovorax sp. BALOs_7]